LGAENCLSLEEIFHHSNLPQFTRNDEHRKIGYSPYVEDITDYHDGINAAKSR
jgi:hypothetical protein